MTRYILLLLLCFIGISIQAQNAEPSDEEAVKQSINQFFESLEKQDTALLKDIAFMEGQVWTLNLINDPASHRSRFFGDDLKGFDSKNDWLETPLSFEIKIHKDIAMAWVPYEFRVNGDFSHCGIDIFTLMKKDGRWTIMTVAYSVEKEGCGALKD